MTLSLKFGAIIRASYYEKAELGLPIAKTHFLNCTCVQDVKSGFTPFYQLKLIHNNKKNSS